METTVGERLRKFRKSLELNQSQFAEPLGVTHAAISKAEANDELSEDLAEKICNHYKIDLKWLLGEEHGNASPGKRQSDKFATEMLARIEERWKAENDLLRERIKLQDEQIEKKDKQLEQKDNLIEALVKEKLLKLEATEVEPQEEGAKVIPIDSEILEEVA